MRKKHVIRFCTLFLVGMCSSAIPWLHFGMLFGFIPVLISSTILTIIWDDL